MLDGDDRPNGPAGDERDGSESPYPEPDPEADLPDPESELPNVPSPPSVDIPTPPGPDGDVPGELLAGFWTTVLLFNVALLATSLGLMLVGFGVERDVGMVLLAVGVLATVRGYTKYRALEERRRNGEVTTAGEDDEAAASGGNDSSAANARHDDASTGNGNEPDGTRTGPTAAESGDERNC